MGLPVLDLAAATPEHVSAIGDRLREALRASDGKASVEDVFSGVSFQRAVFERLVGVDGVARLEAIGVIARVEAEHMRAVFAVKEIGGKLLFTDQARSLFTSEPLYVDPLWEAPALMRMLLAGPAATGADIGCGCGALAIAMADHCGVVYASDVNPRALDLTRFNAQINRTTNLVVLSSDLFNAYPPELKFDHIVFNSPTGEEISPRHMLRMGESILARFFRELSTRTHPNAVVQVNMCVRDWPDDAYFDRMAGWLGPSAGDFNQVFAELYRLENGLRFLLRRLGGALRYGPSAMRCKAIRRGWLTMRRRPGGRSWILPTNYHLWVHDAPKNAPADLIRTCLAAAEAEATPPTSDKVIPLRQAGIASA